MNWPGTRSSGTKSGDACSVPWGKELSVREGRLHASYPDDEALVMTLTVIDPPDGGVDG